MFEYDVFLSYSSNDKSIVNALAERLNQNGLRVWLDKWIIKPGDSIPLKIQEGLVKSHTLLMCMSPSYFESEWGKMEHYTLLFRDPTNKHRRLIPLLIVDCVRPDFIAHLSYIDWRTYSDEAYSKILASCRERNSEFNSELFYTHLNSGVQLNNSDDKEGFVDQNHMEGNLKSTESSQSFTSSSTDMEFLLIPAGKFIMGSPSYEQRRDYYEGPIREVTITNCFYIGKYVVTQKQWESIMGYNPSKLEGEQLPVESVSWRDTQLFIKKLNEKESTDKYRLPSEAEWEYACRAGTQTMYYFGDNVSKLKEYAWYDENSDHQTHPVGQKKPNFWGLYDMHGNVWEWVQDTWNGKYDGAPSDQSAWEVKDTFKRVCRGGGFHKTFKECRSACRAPETQDLWESKIGFRVVREI